MFSPLEALVAPGCIMHEGREGCGSQTGTDQGLGHNYYYYTDLECQNYSENGAGWSVSARVF